MVGNPSIIDDATGELFIMNDEGFAEFKAKYDHVGMTMSPDMFRIIVEAINLYKREHRIVGNDPELTLLDGINYDFVQR